MAFYATLEVTGIKIFIEIGGGVFNMIHQTKDVLPML
jgi:hypothetical protein